MDELSHKFWTEPKELQLIELWKQSPYLYNNNLREYTDQSMRNRRMCEIAQILKATPIDVKTRMKSLRDSYMRYGKLHKKGCLAKMTARQEWLLHHCKWLERFINHRTALTAAETSNLEEDREADSQDDCDGTNSEESNKFEPLVSQLTYPIMKGIKREREDDDQLMYGSPTTSSTFPIHGEISQIITPQDEDDDALFAKYITHEMRKIKNKKQKAILKNKIQNVLFEAQIEAFSNEEYDKGDS